MEYLRLQYKTGQMSYGEAYELGIIDELGFEESRKLKICRCCGKSDLQWGQFKGKWLLFDGDELHDCPIHPLNTKPPK